MAEFINYRNLEFKISGYDYYATKVSLSAQASVDPIVLDDGSLLNYAPQGAVVGSLSTDFYITGALPNFLLITGVDEAAVSINFAKVEIANCYPKSIRFSVEPFQPILVSADFDWYGNINATEFQENTIADRASYPIVGVAGTAGSAGSAGSAGTGNYIANGYKSYLTTEDILGVSKVLSFEYNASCERPAFFRVDQKTPYRVAKLNKNVSVSLSSKTLGQLLDIYGKTASSTIVLKDAYGIVLNNFSFSGVLTNQSFEISEGQYLLKSADITQTVVEDKVLI